jgi:hypothetical protein
VHSTWSYSDKVYQLLSHGRWFSPDTLASSTTKTGRNDIAEILLKVALNTINQIKSKSNIAKTPISRTRKIRLHFQLQFYFSRRGHGRMVVGFTTTCVISASHN